MDARIHENAVEIRVEMLQQDDLDQLLGTDLGPVGVKLVFHDKAVDEPLDATWIAPGALNNQVAHALVKELARTGPNQVALHQRSGS
jgi:hypothetical protein